MNDKTTASADIGVTKTIDPLHVKIDLRKYKNKWRNKDEYETYQSIRQRYTDMDSGRRANCWWAVPPSEGGSLDRNVDGQVVSGQGTDWAMHWNMCYKLWSQWHEYITGRSNLKSPISLAPVEAFMAEFYKSPVGVVITEATEDDKVAAKIFKEYINFLESKQLDAAKKTGAHEMAITGSAIFHNVFLHKEREVELMLNDEEIEKEVDSAVKSKDQEKKTKIQDRLDQEKKPLTKKETLVEYSDGAIIPVSIYEFFPDPDARCIEGESHESIDCIWRTTPSLEQFRAEFKNSTDPYVIKENIDKIKSANATSGSSQGQKSFFQMPKDILNTSNRVELLKYWNKSTDKYIIIVNDVVIRDGPLPYNHKKLPFSLVKFIDFPFQFYGIGIPAVVESLQAEDESLRNMAIEALKKSIWRAVFINSQVFGSVDTQWDRVEHGMKIEVDGPISGNIEWDQGAPNLPFGAIQQMRQDLHNDSVQATGINSMAYSMPQPNQPVRNNLLTQQSTQLLMAKAMINFGEGYIKSVEQLISIAQQKLPDSYEYIMDDNEKPMEDKDGKKIKKYKTMRVKGKKLINTATGMDFQDIGDEYSDIEINPDNIKTQKKLNVMIDVDRLTPISQGFKVQNVQNAIQFLAPILANPQMLQAPGMTELIHEYVDTTGMSSRIYEKIQDAGSKEDEDRADEQQMNIEKGKSVAGIPGESDAHKMIHAITLIEMNNELNDPQATSDKAHLAQTIALLAQHLQTDNSPKEMMEQTALQMAQPPQPSAAPGGGMPGNGSPTPQDAMQLAMTQGAMNPMAAGQGGPNLGAQAGMPPGM